MNIKSRERIAEACYDELTEFAEDRIRALTRSGKDEGALIALGIYELWDNLTMGFQKEGDSDRLEALFRAQGSPFERQMT